MKNHRHIWGLATKLNHPPRPELHQNNLPVVAPIYQTAKFVVCPDQPLSQQFIYSRVANPTLRALEESLSEMMKQEETVVFSSGMAAISGSLLALLKAQDHLISFREIYRPARLFIKDVLPRFGVEHSILKLSDIPQLETFLRPNTKIIYFESPSNPNLEIADIKKIVAVAKAKNILVVMDGTFGGIHQHNEWGVDVMIHSLTKYANGHGDVLAGSVSGSKKLLSLIRGMNIALGSNLDPHAASLVSRGLKTYFLRFDRQTKTAQTVAEFLVTHPKIKKVHYPGLQAHGAHQLAGEQMKQFGGILAFEIDPSVGLALEFSYRLKLLQFTVSVGSSESLICPTELFFGDDLSPADKLEMAINPYSLRLSVGLEDAADIIHDLKEALS